MAVIPFPPRPAAFPGAAGPHSVIDLQSRLRRPAAVATDPAKPRYAEAMPMDPDIRAKQRYAEAMPMAVDFLSTVEVMGFECWAIGSLVKGEQFKAFADVDFVVDCPACCDQEIIAVARKVMDRIPVAVFFSRLITEEYRAFMMDGAMRLADLVAANANLLGRSGAVVYPEQGARILQVPTAAVRDWIAKGILAAQLVDDNQLVGLRDLVRQLGSAEVRLHQLAGRVAEERAESEVNFRGPGPELALVPK